MHERRDPEFDYRNLQVGDHLCCIYETEAEYLGVLIPFIRQGIERGERVFYIVDARTAETIARYLDAEGLDAAALQAAGQLRIETSDATYTQGGEFSPQGMIAMLSAETQRALDEGFPALRVTGEMTWALHGLPGSERLMEYEALLNDFIEANPCIGLCQYDRRRFAPDVLLQVLTTHPFAVIGATCYENFYYMPPEDFLGPDPERARLEQWIFNLEQHKRDKEALYAAQARWEWVLRTMVDGVVLVDVKGEITYANPAADRILELQRDEILKRTYHDPAWQQVDTAGQPLPPEQLPLAIALLQQREAIAVDHTMISSAGALKWLSVNAAPLVTESGQLSGAIATFRDITAQREAEAARLAQLEREITMLEQLVGARSAMVSAQFFGRGLLRTQAPDFFAQLTAQYAALLERALERQIYKTGPAALASDLQQLAESLGRLQAGPRDVVELHTYALKSCTEVASPLKAQAYTEEGRLVLVELLGYLVSFYRALCVGVRAARDVAAGEFVLSEGERV